MRWALVPLAAALLSAICVGCGGEEGPIRLGVMLPLSGPDAAGYSAPLQWAVENVNAAGGIDGRQIQLVYRDIGRESVASVAPALAQDHSIAAVIGPDNSQDARKAATVFIKAHKVLLTPSATSADLVRAFAGQRPIYFRQTVVSDIAQVRVQLRLAARQGARSVALVAGAREYGTTFYDWLGFLATEQGLRVTSSTRYDEDAAPCQPYIDGALATRPDVLIAVPDHVRQAICMAKEWQAKRGATRLLFSDSAQRPSLISSLGAGAQGLEGTGLAPAPGSGFAGQFQSRFGYPPSPYAANAYDAVLVLAYGLQRSGGEDGAPLAKGISSVLAGGGESLGWDKAAVRTALGAIRAGRHPRLGGAAGTLRSERDAPTEPADATYEHWQVRNRRYVILDYLSTQDRPDQNPTLPGERLAGGGVFRPGPKRGLWALIVATSDGWENYRHQADAMAQYQLLRANGVPASHIVVVMADDLAFDKRNPKPGTVRYVAAGPDLHRGLHVDYPLHGMTAERMMAILSGQRSAENPKVIESGAGDNVYVYLAGHGNAEGLYLGLGDPVPPLTGDYSILTPALLDGAIAKMASEHRYRRMLVAVEGCASGALGSHLDAPGALLISAASPTEDSLSTHYEVSYGTWLADEFSSELWRAESQRPQASLEELTKRVYLSVEGSHVGTYGPRFGDARAVPLRDFLSP